MLCKECVYVVGTANCPAGYTERDGRCFKVYLDKLNWNDAQKRCESDGANLAVPTSIEQNKWLFELAQSAGKCKVQVNC